ncbi:MAG: hypothetical protein JSR46_02435 [Verrucomicrobia bacterium]|nr:hypothetical protein [Verrucomicrobiota bacterium]
MSFSPSINNKSQSSPEGHSSLLTQRYRSNSHEYKQPLQERHDNGIRPRPAQQEFSFSEVFGEKQDFYSQHKNYQMKDIVNISNNENTGTFKAYLKPGEYPEASIEPVITKTPYKHPKKEPLKASKASVLSTEEKKLVEIIDTKLQSTNCLFAMDEDYEEAEGKLLQQQQRAARYFQIK